MRLNWHNPHWGKPDVVCPHCGTGWDDHTMVDEEYGYFTLEDGEDVITVDCSEYDFRRNEKRLRHGCEKTFRIKRTVKIDIKYEPFD